MVHIYHLETNELDLFHHLYFLKFCPFHRLYLNPQGKTKSLWQRKFKKDHLTNDPQKKCLLPFLKKNNLKILTLSQKTKTSSGTTNNETKTGSNKKSNNLGLRKKQKNKSKVL